MCGITANGKRLIVKKAREWENISKFKKKMVKWLYLTSKSANGFHKLINLKRKTILERQAHDAHKAPRPTDHATHGARRCPAWPAVQFQMPPKAAYSTARILHKAPLAFRQLMLLMA